MRRRKRREARIFGVGSADGFALFSPFANQQLDAESAE